MEQEEAVTLFENLTQAPRHIAEHVLEAHAYDVNSAVEWYLESGGVGHGVPVHAVEPQGSPPDFIEEPEDEEEPLRAAAAGRPSSRPLPAAARPHSSPIEILDDDDEDIQVLATSLGRRRSNRVDAVAAEEAGMHRVGSVEDELEVGSQGRRVRRNRRRMAGEVDRDLELLGQRFGVMDEFQPAPAAQPRATAAAQQQGAQGPAAAAQYRSGSGGSGRRGDGGDNGGDDDEMPVLPDDVDLEEQRMLMAAIQGGGYEGQLPDFTSDPRYRPRVLSPGAQARQTLREEQDAAYYESLRADREKAEAAERAQREAEEAERREAELAAAEARRQQEEAERLERELSSKAASLPPEPAPEDPDAVNLMIRLPAGGRYSRRFTRTDTLQSVFDFVDVQSGVGGDIQPGSYNLATAYPRRVLQDGAAAQTLADAGLSAKQEALFLELK